MNIRAHHLSNAIGAAPDGRIIGAGLGSRVGSGRRNLRHLLAWRQLRESADRGCTGFFTWHSDTQDDVVNGGFCSKRRSDVLSCKTGFGRVLPGRTGEADRQLHPNAATIPDWAELSVHRHYDTGKRPADCGKTDARQLKWLRDLQSCGWVPPGKAARAERPTEGTWRVLAALRYPAGSTYSHDWNFRTNGWPV